VLSGTCLDFGFKWEAAKSMWKNVFSHVAAHVYPQSETEGRCGVYFMVGITKDEETGRLCHVGVS
jgi:hypothetical protein